MCPTTWDADVEPLVEQNCTNCHGAALPAGGYSLASYLGALGSGQNGTEAVAGDRNSRLVTAVTDPSITAHANIPNKDAIVATLQSWVAPEGATLADRQRCELAMANSLVHQPGILNPSSPDFHGKLAAGYLFDLNVCADCHAKDFTGGATQQSCFECHVNGPTACDTCHGQPPEDGAHPGHVQGRTTGKAITCDNCHPVPATWDTPGHIPVENGRLAPPVVTFGTLAGASPPPASRTGAATWNRTAQTCTNVYCHGGVFNDARATLPLPTWGMRAAPLGCTGCHGTPPTDHATQTAAVGPCYFCHDRVVTPLAPLPNALHIDGQVEIGESGLSACNSCHGSDVNPAPPRDLSGNFAPTAIGVGAHQSHVQGLHGVANPIGCPVCHPDVTAFDSPGHINATAGAQVFPNNGAGTLAAADSATVTWNPATAECTVYCHGSGAKLSPDVAPGLNHTPVWTRVAQGEAGCGSCHGIPPQNGLHSPMFTLQQCYLCHPKSIDQFGNFVFTGTGTGRTTTHANGAVDVF